jgi:hypothetical protein
MNPLILAATAVIASAVAVTALSGQAWPHDALPTAAQPHGWRYPFSCCSGYDCREVPDSAVAETPDGYVIRRTGEVIPYSDVRVKDSPDGRLHWCSVAGEEDSRTICLFRAPRGF